MGRRDRFDIINDLLEAVKSGKNKKTQMMYEANLSFSQINKEYLPLIERKVKFIEIDENNGGGFKLTERGREFQRLYKYLKGMTSYS